jgi:hypothetical protein
VAIASGGPASIPRFTETDHELWYADRDRWRTDAGDQVIISALDAVYHVGPGPFAIRSTEGPRALNQWDAVLRPWTLLGQCEIEIDASGEVCGRATWMLRIRPGANERQVGRPAMLPFFGQEHTVDIDQATGLLLAIVGRFEGATCTAWTTTEFELLDTIDEAVLTPTPPPGRRFLSPLEHQVAMLELSGADVSGLDRNDPAQVHEAVARGQAWSPPSPREEAEQYLPTGRAPADLAAAEAQVTLAFEQMFTIAEDGSVPAVQGGSNLGPSLKQASSRAPGSSETPVEVVVEHVKVLGPDDAVAWIRLQRAGQALLPYNVGRARRHGDGWLVTRETFCGFLRTVGVRCPPPPSPDVH